MAALSKVAGILVALGLTIVPLYAAFYPLPKWGLGSRGHSVAVAVLVGFFSLVGTAEQFEKGQGKGQGVAAAPSEHQGSESALVTIAAEAAPAKSHAPGGPAGGGLTQGAPLEASNSAMERPARVDEEQVALKLDYVDPQAELRRRLEQPFARIEKKIRQGNFTGAREDYAGLAKIESDLSPIAVDLEEAALAIVRPLPVSELELNRDGYLLLATIRSDIAAYKDKADQYARRIEDGRTRAVSMLRQKVDKIEGVTYYKHPNEPKFLNSRSTAYLYIGRRGTSQPWLRMKVQYTSHDWLFVENVYAWHDGFKELLISGPFERDNNTTIWEWRDVVPDGYQLEVLRSLATAKEAILRFEGMQYRRDVTLSAGDKKAILEVLAAYAVM